MLYEEFVSCAKHLLEISNSINDGWTLKHHKDSVYLVKSMTQLSEEVQSSNNLEKFNLELTVDEQAVVEPPINLRKWEYHVLHSVSYQVPVIYFNVWKSNGELLSLEDLWKVVEPNFQPGIFENKWFTLTQRDHPYLFKPFFYFHPCQTEEFFKLFPKDECNMLIAWLSSIGQFLEMDETGESLEGFLCPDCLMNFKTAVQLTSHYQDKHSDDFLKSVKEIYGKAKKKILFKEPGGVGVSESEEWNIKRTTGYKRSEVSHETGAVKSHTEFFKTIRTHKIEHYAAQTNNLIIRLEKLIINLPSDPVKRKVHEQEVVPWLNEKDVKLCPGCAKSFNLLRRKHHCRLCGSIMCNECTFLLQLDLARKMTNSLISSEESPPAADGQPTKKLSRSPAGATVQSVLSLDLTSEPFFRVCEYCYKLLEIRQKLKEVRNHKPIICQFYDKMKASMDEVNSLLPVYKKMFNSLSAGEATHNLSDAEHLREKILKQAENIDLLSSKIAVLGQNSENPPSGHQLILQKAVRNAAVFYLKEHIVSLPSLPKAEQIREAQERRRLEIARRIEEENKLEELEVDDGAKSSKAGGGYVNKNPTSSSSSKEMLIEDGWTPEISQTSMGIISDHPIIQQINIIKDYIKQAESANRSEEVATLQQNLRDLEEEFWRQTKESYESMPQF